MLSFYAIIHCLAAYVLHLVCMIFGTSIPYIVQRFNENVFTLVLLIVCTCSCAELHLLYLGWSLLITHLMERFLKNIYA